MTCHFMPRKINFSSEVIMDMELYINWKDHRLSFSNCTGFLGPSVMREIWLPRPYLHHLTSVYDRDQITANSDYLEASASNGLVWWIEITAGIQCSFDFTFYPFDHQECIVKLSSNSFPHDVVSYSSNKLIRSNYGIQHDLHYSVEYSMLAEDEDLTFFGGNYHYTSCGFVISLDRKLSQPVVNLFLPSAFIVIISFFG